MQYHTISRSPGLDPLSFSVQYFPLPLSDPNLVQNLTRAEKDAVPKANISACCMCLAALACLAQI